MTKCHDFGSAATNLQYGGQACKHLVHTSGSLPFTGAPALMFAIIALILLVAGIALYRANRGTS